MEQAALQFQLNLQMSKKTFIEKVHSESLVCTTYAPMIQKNKKIVGPVLGGYWGTGVAGKDPMEERKLKMGLTF